jgi:1-aminocyclopropane-1-carboxylate deaminase/D-cysteine desulfhydrase-like pyridoxal-dependent ACC family enzyme
MAPFPHHSRIHPLRSFKDSCFVKREDELGFGISGTKVRKYLSLLPSILQDKPQEAIVTGSAYSNHVLSFSQLLKENGIEPILFLLGDESCKMQGNLLYSALIAGLKNIHWVSRSKWLEIDHIVETFAHERREQNIKTLIVPKGGSCAAALPGSLTLALDILRNEEEMGLTFDHLFIDSGTGLTSCALLLAFAYLRKSTFLHIVQIAGDEAEFHDVLEERKADLEALVGEPVPSPTLFRLYRSSIAPSFGAANAALFRTIADIAHTEGFLTDPVFTAKLFNEGKKILFEQKLTGNVLFIHSGGGLGLTGFQEEISKTL